MNNEREISLINKQINATYIYLGAFVISIILLRHNKKRLIGQTCFFSDNTCGKLSIFNRSLILILTIAFLILNYQHMDIYGTDDNALVSENLQIDASWLSFAAACIVLYATIKNSNSYGNPED